MVMMSIFHEDMKQQSHRALNQRIPADEMRIPWSWLHDVNPNYTPVIKHGLLENGPLMDDFPS